MGSGFRYVMAGACVLVLFFVGLSLSHYLPPLQPGAVINPPAPAPVPANPTSIKPRAVRTSQRIPARSRTHATAPAPPARGGSAPPANSGTTPPPMGSTPAPAAGAQPPVASNITVQPYPQNRPEPQVMRDYSDEVQSDTWLLAKSNIILRKKPNGDPLFAPRLTRAPLTVFGGSYLREIERKEHWVLVLSPGHTLGWVHDSGIKPASL